MKVEVVKKNYEDEDGAGQSNKVYSTHLIHLTSPQEEKDGLFQIVDTPPVNSECKQERSMIVTTILLHEKNTPWNHVIPKHIAVDELP